MVIGSNCYIAQNDDSSAFKVGCHGKLGIEEAWVEMKIMQFKEWDNKEKGSKMIVTIKSKK